MKRTNPVIFRILSAAFCALLLLQGLPGAAFAAPGGSWDSAILLAEQNEPTVETEILPAQAVGTDELGSPILVDTQVEQYTFTFSTVPTCYEEIIQYELDSPYKTMALLILAFRTWTPENPDDCLEMLDYLTDTGSTISGSDEPCPFSRYTPWVSALKDRMAQNSKYRYIGNAYLGGATAENDYTPSDPITVTLRQSVYEPYAAATEETPEQYQVLVSLAGADNDRYCLFSQDEEGNWKVFRRSWINLLADVKTPEMDLLLPPEKDPLPAERTQTEPTVETDILPARAAGVDEAGNPILIDTTVEQYTFTFSTVPTCYEDIIQYQLDSPYKTMALYFLALRTWTPEDPDTCARMLDYLTNPNVDSGETDSEGKKLSKSFSEYSYWNDFLRDRMTQNDKYRYIGNAYLGGASPENDYTPTEPITVTVRQSVYDPYKAAEDRGSPELKQVLIHIDGADNDRYGLLYQDQRGDWRFFSDHWKGLLADVQTPLMDILLPPETGPIPQVRTQVEPEERIYEIPAKVPGYDDNDNPIIIDTTVKQHSFTFTTIPTCYEEIIQYELDSPYKTMALMILAFRTWTPENRTDCLEMMDYLTSTGADSHQNDAQGRKLSRKFSEYQFWTDFVRDRMMQNNKYRYIGNAYLEGAMPSNDYTPTLPITITLRESVYNPYKGSDGHLTDPTLYQVLISIAGADNDRYSIFYQDPRGDWRVWGDNWKGLLTDVQTPSGDIPLPPEVVRSDNPANPQTEPMCTVEEIPAMAVDGDDNPIPVTVAEYTFTFSTVPTCYEDIVQYELDSPYKTMALLFLAFRAWDPADPAPCLEMLDYLTNTAVPEPLESGETGPQFSYPFSRYYPWISFLQDRMLQNDKYGYIGNAYLKGAAPTNDYTPEDPVTVVVRQSVYDPYKAESTGNPEIKQVLVSLAGADSDRYALFYQDQRGDWRVFGDNWKGLLAQVQTPRSQLALFGATLDPLENTVAFRVNGLDDSIMALVASYGHEGQFLNLAWAALGEDGICTAPVSPRGERYQIFLLDRESGVPLCKSVRLNK